MIKQRYFAGRVLVYGLISVTVMLSAAMTGCNNKNNISEGSIKTEGSTKTEGNNQSEEFSETDVNDQPSDIHVEPPVIHGISDKTYYIGTKVSYMTDVYATDFSGQEIDVEVDKSQVNTSQPGSYIVYYKAVDSDGNETIEEVTFTFIEEETQEVKVNSSYSTLDEVVAAVLQDITDSSMSKGQKARAIYKYAHAKIGYTGNSYTKSSEWQDEAFEALRRMDMWLVTVSHMLLLTEHSWME